jgi:hypothetical protein
MSTHAEVIITSQFGKKYTFWIHSDGYPEGVIPHIPSDVLDLEEIRRALYLEDMPDPCPDYYYEIDLGAAQVRIFDNSFAIDKTWRRGPELFNGSIAAAKEIYK